ncbi:unnamed protein product [Thlaspi arvense]|uniref:GH18 domain-containing protein n=1 Tax=Thlaspi arvense TaxID=13288 RepID=A0AAU9S306_THLAR|nr:unnamed protein product [Thlaspi arvense]
MEYLNGGSFYKTKFIFLYLQWLPYPPPPLIFPTFLSSSSLLYSANAVRSAYWFPDSGIEASAIDSTLFTRLFCAFADLDSTTNQVTISSSNEVSFAQFTETVQLKNPSVKTLMSIGGGNADEAAYTTMAAQAPSRKSFIDSSISLARSYGFHGLDLDWEYPNTTSGMTNFGLLVNEWRSAVAAEATTSGKPALFLTAAVYYAPSIKWLV